MAALLFSGCQFQLGVPQSVIKLCRGNQKCITYCTDLDDDPLRRKYCRQLVREQREGINEPTRPVTTALPKVRVLDVSIGPLPTPNIVDRSMPAIVTILAGLNFGTGFAVTERGFIVTNLHVIEGQPEILVVMANGRTERVSHVIAYDKTLDLAILRASGLRIALPMANGHVPNVGESVVAIGHPHGFTSTVSTGIISGRRVNEDNLAQWQTSVPMGSGASGGPLMDEHGRVIGIMQAMIREAPHLTFAIPIEYLQVMLHQAKTTPAPISVAEFARQTATPEPEPEPDSEPELPPTPPVAPEILKGCSMADRARMDSTSAETIEAAKHLCDEGDVTPCAHLYLGAAMALEAKLSVACAGPRGILSGGRTATLKLRDPEDQAKAMHTLFESLGGGARATP